jgi:two-component system chemotaxis response regulator CheY
MAEPKCVLIVDDNARVRQALRSLFTSNGFEVCGEAVNGLDAIEKARELHPDLILLDLSMPLMNGLEAARNLSNIMPDVPLMMFTTDSAAALVEEAHRAGIVELVSKDGPYSKLVTQARKLLT